MNPTTKKAWFYAFVAGVYSLLPLIKEIIERNVDWFHLHSIPSAIHGVSTVAVGSLLVFRTNTAYAKWWEARKIWGQLVNCSRNLGAKIATFTNIDPSEREEMHKLIAGFAVSLKDHLRGQADLKRIPGFENTEQAPKHVPGFITHAIYDHLSRWHASKLIDGDTFRSIDLEARQLLEICGACERILKTRISKSYQKFIHQCVLIFLITLPWGIVDDLGWWTLPTVVIVSYFIVGLEVVADAVDEPFGHDADDLDLDGLCRTIDETVGELLSFETASDGVSV